MQILGLLKADESTERGDPPSQELVERMTVLMEEITRAGVLLATDGLLPTSAGKRIKLADGKVTVIDGPFTESKELVASYALFKVETWDEAIHWTTRFLECLGQGEVELRPIFELSDFPSDVVTPEIALREEAVRARMEKNA